MVERCAAARKAPQRNKAARPSTRLWLARPLCLNQMIKHSLNT